MRLQNQLIERRIYSLALQHKICKEHIEEGAKQCDLQRISISALICSPTASFYTYSANFSSFLTGVLRPFRLHELVM